MQPFQNMTCSDASLPLSHFRFPGPGPGNFYVLSEQKIQDLDLVLAFSRGGQLIGHIF